MLIMLNSGKKISRQKKIYSNSCVVRKKNSERKKNIPPLQVKWSVPYCDNYPKKDKLAINLHILLVSFLLDRYRQEFLIISLVYDF